MPPRPRSWCRPGHLQGHQLGERGRETWARIAADGVWALAWGDKGAPRGPDPERVTAAREEVQEATQALTRAKAELDTLEAKKKIVRQEAIAVAGLVDGAMTLKAMLRLDELADEIVSAVGAVGSAERRLDQAQRELEDAMTALVPLSDEAPADAGAELLAEVVYLEVGGKGEALIDEPYRRDKITPREFQWALGGPGVVAESTLRRYLAGKMPYRRGDRRNIWDPPLRPGDLPDCVERPSPRKAFILLGKLDWTRFPVAVIDRLKYLQTVGEEGVFLGNAAA